jgi:site-specific DNA-methyltransferase (adenine-specific)
MLSDADAWKHGSWSNQRVVEGDALNLGMLVQGETFPSTIFSPPYANRFDYFESLKVELWFGGFVKDYSDLALLRKRSLRSHLGADLRKPSVALPELEALLELMDRSSSSWRMKVPSALRGYFHDMSVTLQRCREVAPRGGRCFVVVGNSAYAGVIVPTDVLLANLGLAAGFKQATIHVVRHLTVAPQQRVALGGLEAHMRESLLEFTA